MDQVFEEFAQALSEEEVIRQKIRDERDALDIAVEKLSRHLNAVHHTVDRNQVVELASHARSGLKGEISVKLTSMINAIPNNQFYRYHDLFRSQLQDIAFVAILSNFLLQVPIPSIQMLRTDLLGLDPASGVVFPTEDYMVGMCAVVSELARMTVNRVTVGDFEFAPRVSIFAADIYQGFRALNFRNDFLRKKYDAMKYDIKKIEEIVYDLSVRSLLQKR